MGCGAELINSQDPDELELLAEFQRKLTELRASKSGGASIIDAPGQAQQTKKRPASAIDSKTTPSAEGAKKTVKQDVPQQEIKASMPKKDACGYTPPVRYRGSVIYCAPKVRCWRVLVHGDKYSEKRAVWHAETPTYAALRCSKVTRLREPLNIGSSMMNPRTASIRRRNVCRR